ncbi:MAG: hypothetical protein DMF63_07815 [Acidobacteria bacterium]|nr:MAG: hypothetical protein DMF63_07815 [Acidobacteriota bacterium]
MSKSFLLFYLASVVLFLMAAASVRGQETVATMTIDAKNPELINVDGKFATGSNRKNLSFLRSVAGTQGLANRISDLRLFDSAGAEVAFKKLSDGEYLSDANFVRWTYTIDVTPLKNRSAAAHASWFVNGTGILMLADLLPEVADKSKRSGRLTFETPATHDDGHLFVHSSEKRSGNTFEVEDVEDAVFYVGYVWKRGASSNQPDRVAFLISGEWKFAASSAADSARELYVKYEHRYGQRSSAELPFVAIARFPTPTDPGAWEAETRGNNVTIISSDTPFQTQSSQRLDEQLRHEIFHLWIPNGVNLTGNYDWFYEGFALYQSLKIGIDDNRIRFDDFLDTLSRAHTIDSAPSQRISLIQASKNRFGGSSTQIYARGMLVAFLTDLAMLEQSKGKRSVENLLKDLYMKHRKPAAPVDGNTAVIEMLKTGANATSIVDRYVAGVDKIEWTDELAAAGIEDSDPGPVTTLQVKKKLSGRQKAMLDRLGYNNWRKLSATF